MSNYKHPLGGNISEHGPLVCTPALGVVTIIAEDNSTIDMTLEQALKVAERIPFYVELAERLEAANAHGR